MGDKRPHDEESARALCLRDRGKRSAKQQKNKVQHPLRYWTYSLVNFDFLFCAEGHVHQAIEGTDIDLLAPIGLTGDKIDELITGTSHFGTSFL